MRAGCLSLRTDCSRCRYRRTASTADRGTGANAVHVRDRCPFQHEAPSALDVASDDSRGSASQVFYSISSDEDLEAFPLCMAFLALGVGVCSAPAIAFTNSLVKDLSSEQPCYLQ